MDIATLRYVFQTYGLAAGLTVMGFGVVYYMIKRGFSFSMKMNVGDKR